MASTKDVAKKLVAIATMLSVESALNGCSGVMATDPGDHLLLYGDASALRAWSDYQQGVITNSKASPDTNDTPYYQLRRLQAVKMKDIRRENGNKK